MEKYVNLRLIFSHIDAIFSRFKKTGYKICVSKHFDKKTFSYKLDFFRENKETRNILKQILFYIKDDIVSLMLESINESIYIYQKNGFKPITEQHLLNEFHKKTGKHHLLTIYEVFEYLLKGRIDIPLFIYSPFPTFLDTLKPHYGKEIKEIYHKASRIYREKLDSLYSQYSKKI